MPFIIDPDTGPPDSGDATVENGAVTATVTSTVLVTNYVAYGMENATFWVDVTAIGAGDTWDLAVEYACVKPVARTIAVASKVTITAVGNYRMALAADFSATRMAAPNPNFLRLTRQVAGGTPTITATFFMVRGQ